MKAVDERRVRMTAGERREEILEAAVAEFAVHGLYGTSTEAIAHRAGVSQPYLFRLFGTKKDLFIAAVHRGFDRVQRVFEEAASAAKGSAPEAVLGAMGASYVRLLSQRDELLLQLHSYAACADPEVQSVVHERWEGLNRFAQETSGAADEAIQQFFANGLYLTVSAVMGVERDWAELVEKCLPGG
jgi:AcrR family transcriptional regulator